MSGSSKALSAMVVGFAAALLAPRDAHAISLGSETPPEVAFKAGAFDSVAGHHPAALVGAEYRFGQTFWYLRPFVGTTVTTEYAVYGYAGLGLDIAFGPHWVLTPNAAAGFFSRGNGTNLGSSVEFRSGAELDYRFDDSSKIGLTVHHDSNAGLSHRNPGEEEIGLVYAVPLKELTP